MSKFKHWLWVKYTRIRYPKRPPGETEPLLIRDDGLMQYPEHTASPWNSDAPAEHYPRTCFQVKLK